MYASGEQADGPAPKQHEELSMGQMGLANGCRRVLRALFNVVVANLAGAGLFFVLLPRSRSVIDPRRPAPSRRVPRPASRKTSGR
jgi:hypothetical protein